LPHADRPSVRAPKGPDAETVNKALDAAIAGKTALTDVRLTVSARADKVELAVYGGGVAFAGSHQVKLSPEQVRGLLKLVRDSGFAGWKRTYGGMKRPAGGPMIGAPVMLVRSMTVKIGEVEKHVNQLGGGEQFKELLDLMKALDAAVKPALAKGVDIGALSRDEALAKIADGTLAPEALAVNLVVTPRDRKQRNRMWSLHFYRGSVNLRVDGKFGKLDLPRPEVEAVGRRLAAALAKADMGAMPRQLYHPTAMVGMGMSIRGRTDRIDLSADRFPYNLKQKKTHPKGQKAFDGLMREIKAIHGEVAKPRPTTQPARPRDAAGDATR